MARGRVAICVARIVDRKRLWWQIGACHRNLGDGWRSTWEMAISDCGQVLVTLSSSKGDGFAA